MATHTPLQTQEEYWTEVGRQGLMEITQTCPVPYYMWVARGAMAEGHLDVAKYAVRHIHHWGYANFLRPYLLGGTDGEWARLCEWRAYKVRDPEVLAAASRGGARALHRWWQMAGTDGWDPGALLSGIDWLVNPESTEQSFALEAAEALLDHSDPTECALKWLSCQHGSYFLPLALARGANVATVRDKLRELIGQDREQCQEFEHLAQLHANRGHANTAAYYWARAEPRDMSWAEEQIINAEKYADSSSDN